MTDRAYTVLLLPGVARALKKLKETTVRRRLVNAIDCLASDPRPAGAVALAGGDGVLRIRVGDYRVLYTVRDDALTVLVVTLGHRRDGYER